MNTDMVLIINFPRQIYRMITVSISSSRKPLRVCSVNESINYKDVYKFFASNFEDYNKLLKNHRDAEKYGLFNL